MDNKHRFILWTVVLVAAVSLLPFLGNTGFNTKGEPREAVVAVSMLTQHNWILPENNGVDIPYKPPFFQWCIAAFSLPAGHVTEFTSRLPSALALIFMLAMGAVFYAKRRNTDLSFLASMFTLTAFEVHRAGTNCRVDMVLTMFIVCGLYALYRWWEGDPTPNLALSKTGHARPMHGMPWMAILCMSGATLTKGPVGIVLPCFVMFVFIWMENWLSSDATLKGKALSGTLKLFFAALLACVLPALWYFAAYHQGGKAFLDLVMDENVGRFLGKMKFVTHDNPWPYNILMLISGWLPWTLPILLSIFILPWKKGWRRVSDRHQLSLSHCVERLRNAFAFRQGDGKGALQLFTWLAFLLILFFYCIPKSKRGVYLLPCYPFMAVLIVEYAVWLMKRSHFPIRFYIGFLTVFGFLLTAVLVVLRMGVVPDSIFHGKHAYDNIQMLHALAFNSLGVGDILMLLLPLCAACLGLMILLHRKAGFITERPVLASTFMTLLIYMAFNGYYKPTVMNTKSMRPFAMEIKKVVNLNTAYGSGERTLYAFTGFYAEGSDPLRFYGIDFYLNDCIRQFDKDRPVRGLLMVNEGNDATLHSAFDKDYYFTKIYTSQHRETEFGDIIFVYSFISKKELAPSLAER